MIAEIVEKLLKVAGVKVSRTLPQPWESDRDYLAVRAGILGTTLVREPCLHFIWQCAKQTASLGGDAAELGVFKGGTARLIASAEPKRRLHLFDTFTGNPKGDPALDGVDAMSNMFCDTSLESVRAFLSGCNVEFHSGLFPATGDAVRDRSFSFVYLDADLHDSIRAGCEFFYPRIVPGGVMVIDDYGGRWWPGTKCAAEEFFAQKPERIIAMPFFQAMIIKLPG